MHPLENKFRILSRLAKVAIVGVALFLLALVLNNRAPWAQLPLIAGVISFLPCFLYAYVLTILHWKARYRGKHSDLWGVLLLVETSGFFKVIYFFRHIVPDVKGRGRCIHETPVA